MKGSSNFLAALLLLTTTACNKNTATKDLTDTSQSVEKNEQSAEKNIPDESTSTSVALTCEKLDTTYQGFGGRSLQVGLGADDDQPINHDRYKLKPFSAYSQDIERITGVIPESLANAAATLEPYGARWWEKPEANSITLFASFRIAYEASLKWIATQPNYQSIASSDEIDQQCQQFAEMAWQKPATLEQIQQCRQFLLENTSPGQEADIRWAYTLAALLTSAEFLSY